MRSLPLYARTIAILLLITLGIGCQALTSNAAHATDGAAAADIVRRADQLIADLPRSGGTRQQRLLTAATLYVSAEAYANALAALNQIDADALPRERRGDFLVASVDAALGAGDLATAWAAVARPPEGRYAFINDLTAGDVARVADRRAVVLERKGRLVDAARARGIATAGLGADLRLRNEQDLWSLLVRLDGDQLRELAQTSEGELAGWVELARIYRSSLDSPSTLGARLADWLDAHPQHPAAQRPPQAITRTRAIGGDPVKRIAVLLPLHGKLASIGRAVQRGTLVAWHAAARDGVKMPELRFYDASRSDFPALYDQAVADGASVVVGPIDKDDVKSLQQRDRLPVPTIALNYPDTPGGPAQLYFFGLSGDDEARQVAQRALADGVRHAVIISPAGDWGRHLATQFGEAFAAGGGDIRGIGEFQGNGDYGDVVQRLLDTQASELRHDRLQRILGQNLAFEAHRRQDIDSIFLIANTLQATQIVPAIQYHHAGELPAYATSLVNSSPTRSSGADLKGLRFVETPWVAYPQNALRRDAESAWSDIDDRYVRLYALGVDALRLGQQLPLLLTSPDASLEGSTGTLTLGTDRRVRRSLVWMQFRDGNAERLDATP